MSGSPTIKAASVFDLAVLEELHAEAFPEESWNAAALQSVLKMPGAFCRIAINPLLGGGQPVGFTIGLVVGPECELLSLGVSLSARRQGIGQCLLLDFIDFSNQSEASEIFLEVAEDNNAARALYQLQNFEIVGRRPYYYRRQCKTRVAALQLRRKLS